MREPDGSAGSEANPWMTPMSEPTWEAEVIDTFDYELAFRRLRARGEIKIVPSEMSRGYSPYRVLPGGRRAQVHLGWDPMVKIEFTPHQDSPEQKKRKQEWYKLHGRIGPWMVGVFFTEIRDVERPTLREAMEDLLEATRPRTGDLYEMVLEKRDFDRERDAHAAIFDAVAMGVMYGEHAA